MSLLLDTHALVWWLIEPSRLSESARSRIGAAEEPLYVSAVSGYEIEYKRPRDAELAGLPANLVETIPLIGFDWLEVDAADAVAAAQLEGDHRDPWDRLLAAQAVRRGCDLVTADARLHRLSALWGVKLFW